jgi:hypothetical protein
MNHSCYIIQLPGRIHKDKRSPAFGSGSCNHPELSFAFKVKVSHASHFLQTIAKKAEAG